MTVEIKSPESGKNLVEISKEAISTNIENITAYKIAVWRKNQENVMVTVPADKLLKYTGESSSADIVLYIDKDWQLRIREGSEIKTVSPTENNIHGDAESMDSVKEFGKIDDQVEKFRLMSIPEREEVLDNSIESLSMVVSAGKSMDMEAVLKMVEVVANTFYANHANLQDNISSENLKDNLLGIYVKTEWIIKLVIQFFMREGHSFDEISIIREIDTGSYTMDHINRVFLLFVNFCVFFNEFIDKGLVAKKVRGEFRDRYQKYYSRKIPASVASIEMIIKDGIRRIDVEKELQKYAIGSLLYDIGKVPDIKYHDSSSDYVDNTVKLHSLNSYNMIIKAKGYPFVVSAMGAFHHEYYGSDGSYMYTRLLLSKLTGEKKSEDDIKYFITMNEDEFKNRMALSFFPCKVIEVLDVYDALVSRREKTPVEAFKFMKKNFIAKNLKIDPLVFEIFIEYAVRCGFVESGIRDEVDAIIY